jgi:hypothetical protein
MKTPLLLEFDSKMGYNLYTARGHKLRFFIHQKLTLVLSIRLWHIDKHARRRPPRICQPLMVKNPQFLTARSIVV